MAQKRNVYRGGPKARDYDLFGPELQFYWITPQLAKATAIDDKTLRSEYSRLRAIANKRLARMEGKPEAEGTLARHSEPFPTVRGMDRAEVVRQLGEVSAFLTARRGSLSGIKQSNKDIQEALKKKGVNVPKEQLNKFGAFMNAMKKALGVNRGDYASSQLANLWQDLFSEGKISQAGFERKVKQLLQETSQQREITAAERRRLNQLMRDAPVNTFFDELALDVRTVNAKKRREEKEAESARQACRRASVTRARKRRG